jgi:type I restriction enzyme S subunit
MTAIERVLAHFDQISEAPDAVPRLRRFVLDLAVRGKLVDQDSSDEPASELLKRIDRTEAPRTKNGQVGDKRPSLPGPFPLPRGWIWARFADIAVIRPNLVDPRGYKDHPHIAPDNIESRTGRLLPYDTIGNSGVFSAKHLFQPGSLLYSKIRPALAKAALVDFEGLCSADMYPVLPLINRQYLLAFMLADAFVEQSVTEANRVAMPKINQASLAMVLVAVPPLAEQQRIVAKVHELMALCDRLETAQRERESRRYRLVSASLARLSEPADLPSFHAYTRFHLGHLPRMTISRAQIQQLRSTILRCAVRGHLEPQHLEDQSVADWLVTGSPSREIAESESPTQPFGLPKGWVWRRVGDLFEVAGGIQKTPQRAPRSNAYPYLGVSNVYRGRLDLGTVKSFELQPGELQRRRLEPGDILIIEGNGSLGEIGRCAKWCGEIQDCVHQNHVIRCRPIDVAISDFVLLYLNSPDGVEIMQRLAITSSGLYSLSVGKIRQIAIPIPPRGEQSRIVAKVEELMAVCERLEAELEAVRSAQGALLEATLRDALRGPEPGLGVAAH